MRGVWSKYKPALLRFGIRLAVCLVVIGGAYVAIVGLPTRTAVKPANTDSQKIAAIRASLNEIYLAANDIGSINDANISNRLAINTARSQLDASSTKLTTELAKAPVSVTSQLKADIRKAQADINARAKLYDARFTLLNRAIAYDPAKDIGKLSAKKDKDELTKRLDATATALTQVASDQSTIAAAGSGSEGLGVASKQATTTLLLSEPLKVTFEDSAACFKQLHELASNNKDISDTAKNACFTQYNTTRQHAITSLASSFAETELKATSDQIVSLLTKLDSLTKD